MDKINDTPKYLKLKEYLKKNIQNGELIPGAKIYSENKLAEMFGISRHTVRQAVGEMVNEGWLYRAQGSGTYVCSGGKTRKEESRLVGVITTYLDDYIFPGIIKGIDNVLSKHGYSIILSHTNNKIEREAQCIASMLDRNVDGFIIEPTKSALPNPNLGFYSDMGAKGIPFIFINGYYPSFDSSYVIEDDEFGGYMAANHLFDLGHDSIGGVFKIDDIQGHNRYKGVVRAHRERGVSVEEGSVIWYTTEDVENLFGISNSKNFINRFTNCSGIVCYNDQIALRLLEILKKENISVPADMSIVSFDDSELAVASEIKLTTVAHPVGKLGEKAANYLLEILGHNIDKINEVMKPELIIRNSTRKY